jgi:hypothetical protein
MRGLDGNDGAGGNGGNGGKGGPGIGGGLFIAGGSVTLSNVTDAANVAQGGAGGAGGAGGSPNGGHGAAGIVGTAAGGGAYAGGGSLSAVNVTVTSNSIASGGTGGGLDVNSGTVTLDNSIVALNTSAAAASDIAGTVAVASAFNLIGKGGSGGLSNGVNGNQVGVANPGLGTLANNGGPTETIAVLPGSPAIGKGSSTITGATVPTVDQRGVSRPSNSVDIGAFQDRGFTITIGTGLSPQTAAINSAFANPLAIYVTSPFGDPVPGGTITYTVTPAAGGASATLSAGTAIIGVAGLASVAATANGTTGGYTVTASASGVATPAVFSLTNLASAVSVTGVSVSWGTQTEALQTAADGIRLLPAGRHTDLPWVGINKVSITLSQAATLASGDVKVTGITVANYGPVTISGSGTSYTITFAQPINKADRVTITIANASIATFTRRLDVLPGDFNDDGVVNSADLTGVRNEIFGFNGAAPTIFGDINGDGKVDIKDYNLVKKFQFTTLPTIA